MQSVNGEEIKAILYDSFDTLNRLAQERGSMERKKMLKSIASIVGGIMFLLWTSGVLAESNTPSETTSQAAQTNSGPPPAADQPAGTSGNPEVSAEGESQPAHRVPLAVLAELQQELAAIEVQKSLARQLESQLNDAKSARAERKAQADALKHQLDALKEQIDQARSHLDKNDGASVFEFNSRVEAYDESLAEIREQWKQANALDEPFNDLVTKLKAQYHLVNQMVEAYNAKVRQIGH
jgi:soluble cytochrome b562